MQIFIFRHGKSDKSLQGKIAHSEFELTRSLVTGEEERAQKLGQSLRSAIDIAAGVDLVWSGKHRSRQTVTAIAAGLGLDQAEINANLREDFDLTYLTTESYWHQCEQAVKSGVITSHADYFLQHEPDSDQTYSAQRMRHQMRAAITRAISRNLFLGIETSLMVSHEPVLSLFLSDLTQQSVTNLGGAVAELEPIKIELVDSTSRYFETQLSFRNVTHSQFIQFH